MVNNYKHRNSIVSELKLLFIIVPVFLFIITASCEDNINIDERNVSATNLSSIQTITISEAKEILSLEFSPNGSRYKSNNNKKFKVIPHLDLTRQEPIDGTNEFMTIIPVTTNFENIESNIIMFKKNGETVKSITWLIPNDSIKTEHFTGILGVTNINGKFVSGFRLYNGEMISRFESRKIKKSKITGIANKAASVDPDEGDCYGPDAYQYTCPQLVNEIVLDLSDPNHSDSYVRVWFLPTTGTYHFTISDSSTPEGGPHSGTGTQSVPLYDCDTPNSGCFKEGCPDGYVLNSEGNCIEDPCWENLFDPIMNPTLTESKPGNLNGGRFGYTRKYKNGTEKFHDGFDAKADPNTPFTGIFGGVVEQIRDDLSPNKYVEDSYGNYVIVKSTLEDGSEIFIKYNHLNSVSVSKGQTVTGDTPLGVSGKTGNVSKYVVPHIHIQVRSSMDFGVGSWRNSDTTKNSVNNPEKYLHSKFNEEGNRNQPC